MKIVPRNCSPNHCAVHGGSAHCELFPAKEWQRSTLELLERNKPLYILILGLLSSLRCLLVVVVVIDLR